MNFVELLVAAARTITIWRTPIVRTMLCKLAPGALVARCRTMSGRHSDPADFASKFWLRIRNL